MHHPHADRVHDIIRAVLDLSDAQEFTDVEKTFSRTITEVRLLAEDKYEILAERATSKARTEMHDKRVQLQGGE